MKHDEVINLSDRELLVKLYERVNNACDQMEKNRTAIGNLDKAQNVNTRQIGWLTGFMVAAWGAIGWVAGVLIHTILKGA